MEQKTFLEYAVMVVIRAARKAWDKIGALGTGLGVAVSIIVAYVAEKPKSLADFGSSEAIMAALIFLLLFICAMGFYILREPFIIHNEQQVSKEKLEQELNKLEEAAKPKLELKYDDDNTTSRQAYTDTEGRTGTLFRIRVTNIGTTESIQQMEAYLTEVNTTPKIPYLDAKLGFMHDYGERLHAGNDLWVDVLTVGDSKDVNGETKYEMLFGFADDIPKRAQHLFIKEFRSYEFEVKVSGLGVPSVSKRFEFFVNEHGNKGVFGLREVNNGQPKAL